MGKDIGFLVQIEISSKKVKAQAWTESYFLMAQSKEEAEEKVMKEFRKYEPLYDINPKTRELPCLNGIYKLGKIRFIY